MTQSTKIPCINQDIFHAKQMLCDKYFTTLAIELLTQYFNFNH